MGEYILYWKVVGYSNIKLPTTYQIETHALFTNNAATLELE
jgi:hypothetical protein